jgi:predicted ATPase/DNA-binding SARP family transcriptional activator/DNA-binding CsgD family transcriptional regulator
MVDAWMRKGRSRKALLEAMTSSSNSSPFSLQTLQIQMLGDFRVSCGDREIAGNAWRLRTAQHLIKLLALAPGFCLHRDEIIDYLWPELDPSAAGNNLRYAVHIARRVLGTIVTDDVIQRHGELLRLCSWGGIETDVAQFEAAAAIARESSDLENFRGALALYTGDLLPADRYEDWTVRRREALRDTHLALLFELAGIHASRKDVSEAIAFLQKLTSLDPANEDAHRALMRSYVHCGRRQSALRQYTLLQAGLRQELDVDPDPASQRLYQDILTGQIEMPAEHEYRAVQQEPELAVVASGKHNLPLALTSFVGREQGISELQEHLAAARLVTLTGAGGSGKTRLAIEVARSLIRRFRDGVWMVDLSSSASFNDLLDTTIDVFGVVVARDQAPLDPLIDELHDQELLLLLDNCEHLLETCEALVSTLLHSCPGLRVLATSRARLQVEGEFVWQVPPLDLPFIETEPSIERLQAIESVQLFVERATFVRTDFKLTEANSRAVTQICQYLDGLPLAIELAAARVTMLTPAQIASRLTDSLRLLSSNSRTVTPRHQTIRATIDWSYDLLSSLVRTLLHRLSVFSGGWTLDAAEAVATGDGIDEQDLLDMLSELVDRSFVVVEAEDVHARYRFLEPVRQYAAEQLEASGEGAQVRRKHVEYLLALIEASQKDSTGPVRAVSFKQVERELDNLRAALRWSLEGGSIELGLRLGAALGDFWFVNGRQSEGRSWLSALLEHPASRSTEVAELRAKVIAAAFILAYRQGDYSSALALAESCLELHRLRQDQRGIAWALSSLAMPVGELGDLDRSEALLEESLALSRDLNDTYSIARALDTLGELNRAKGNFERARGYYSESLELFDQLDAKPHIAIVLHNLGQTALTLGDLASAMTRLRQSLRRYQDLGHTYGQISCLSGIAGAATLSGHPAQAARLFGAVHALREQNNVTADAADRIQLQRYLESLRSTLGEDVFLRVWEAGRVLTLEKATVEALALDLTIPPGTSRALSSLSKREQQIAMLVAQGLTNHRIAEQLGIAQRTADTHVSRILHKLGFSSRTELAAWVVSQDCSAE